MNIFKANYPSKLGDLFQIAEKQATLIVLSSYCRTCNTNPRPRKPSSGAQNKENTRFLLSSKERERNFLVSPKEQEIVNPLNNNPAKPSLSEISLLQ